MPFHVYILKLKDGRYYAGHTDDLARRMDQHTHGLIGTTSRMRPLELLWTAEVETRAEALAFELRIKGWSRAKKEALMRGDWNEVQRLARSSGASTGSARTED